MNNRPSGPAAGDNDLNVLTPGHYLWRQFIKEIIPQFHMMNTSIKRTKEIRKGDVVLSLDSKVRGKWLLAIVENVERNKVDGIVRSVIYKHGAGRYWRSVHHVLLLPAVMGRGDELTT